MKKEFLPMELMLAFKLYLEEGLKRVEKVFPQHVEFVKNHQTKRYQEVKEEVLNLRVHA